MKFLTLCLFVLFLFGIVVKECNCRIRRVIVADSIREAWLQEQARQKQKQEVIVDEVDEELGEPLIRGPCFTQCSIAITDRRSCNYKGKNKNKCLYKKCCWDDNPLTPVDKRCYKKEIGICPSPVCVAIVPKERLACLAAINDPNIMSNKTSCLTSSCCWDASDSSEPPCYDIGLTKSDVATCYRIPRNERVGCGISGISEQDCWRRKCCYDSEANTEFRCFRSSRPGDHHPKTATPSIVLSESDQTFTKPTERNQFIRHATTLFPLKTPSFNPKPSTSADFQTTFTPPKVTSQERFQTHPKTTERNQFLRHATNLFPLKTPTTKPKLSTTAGSQTTFLPSTVASQEKYQTHPKTTERNQFIRHASTFFPPANAAKTVAFTKNDVSTSLFPSAWSVGSHFMPNPSTSMVDVTEPSLAPFTHSSVVPTLFAQDATFNTRPFNTPPPSVASMTSRSSATPSTQSKQSKFHYSAVPSLYKSSENSNKAVSSKPRKVTSNANYNASPARPVLQMAPRSSVVPTLFFDGPRSTPTPITVETATTKVQLTRRLETPRPIVSSTRAISWMNARTTAFPTRTPSSFVDNLPPYKDTTDDTILPPVKDDDLISAYQNNSVNSLGSSAKRVWNRNLVFCMLGNTKLCTMSILQNAAGNTGRRVNSVGITQTQPSIGQQTVPRQEVVAIEVSPLKKSNRAKNGGTANSGKQTSAKADDKEHSESESPAGFSLEIACEQFELIGIDGGLIDRACRFMKYVKRTTPKSIPTVSKLNEGIVSSSVLGTATGTESTTSANAASVPGVSPRRFLIGGGPSFFGPSAKVCMSAKTLQDSLGYTVECTDYQTFEPVTSETACRLSGCCWIPSTESLLMKKLNIEDSKTSSWALSKILGETDEEHIHCFRPLNKVQLIYFYFMAMQKSRTEALTANNAQGGTDIIVEDANGNAPSAKKLALDDDENNSVGKSNKVCSTSAAPCGHNFPSKKTCVEVYGCCWFDDNPFTKCFLPRDA